MEGGRSSRSSTYPQPAAMHLTQEHWGRSLAGSSQAHGRLHWYASSRFKHPQSKTRGTGQSSITVTAGQALCRALHCPAPKRLGCCRGSSPFCSPGRKQGGFSASLLQQPGGRDAEGWAGFLCPLAKCSPAVSGDTCQSMSPWWERRWGK